MEFVINRLRDLGSEVAATSDRMASSDRTIANARSRLFSQRAKPSVRRSRQWPRLALAALAFSGLCGVVTVVALNYNANRPVTYVVRDVPTTTRDTFIETKDRGTEIRFSEGSLVGVMPETGLRILDTKPSGVTLSVERGQVRCNVVHKKNTDWTVRAGPFDIRVIGTNFAAQWQPVSGRFELSLHEGSVDVTGPQLSGTQRVVKGERLVVELHRGTKSLTQGQSPTEVPAGNTETELTRERGSAVGEPAPGSEEARKDGQGESQQSIATAAPTRSAEQARWEDLARSGRYKDALKIVDGAGFHSVLARSDAAGVRLLADTARMAGAPRKAQQALLTLRNQHGKKAETAFLLGKIAADQLGAPAAALVWFDTYLAEEPRGQLREQALGRSLELTRRAEGKGARERAKRYLAAYPSGAYAPLAKQVIAAAASSNPK